ncbi:MAG: Transition state regulatory protein AbrB [Dehalococcoidia bacterium]|nr:Transition state regulatory protein AbrB [Bacillota bacterium]
MLKSTGIVRRADTFGRVVIPIELRKTLGIAVKDSLEFFVENERIILKKYEPGCLFCGNTNHVKRHNGRTVCQECIDKLATA